MIDPALPPDFIAYVKDLEARITAMERSPRVEAQAFPAVILGAVRDFGFSTIDTTTYSDLFRADVYLTAPILAYDVQLTHVSGVVPTSIEWQITLHEYFSGGTTAVVAGGSGTIGTQFQGRVNLLDFVSVKNMNRLVRFDVEAKRTGGTGDIGIRLVRPLILRTSL